MDPRIREIEKEFERSDVPAFEPGDTVRVRVRVTEGDKERLQAFEGVCIARRGSGTNETFTVRRVTGGVAVERIFPVHSPSVASVEVVRRGQVRRAKLYYLRGRRGKRARVRERRWWLDAEEAVKAEVAQGEETEGEKEGGETESTAEGPEASTEAGGEAEAEASAGAGGAEPERAPEAAPDEAAEPAAEKE